MRHRKTASATTELSCSGLSEATGIDRRTIKRRLLEGHLDPRKRFRLAEVIDILKPPTPSGDSAIKDKTEFERWRKLKIANDHFERALIERSKVTSFFAALASRQIGILRQRLENELPTAMAGVDPGSGRVIAKRVVDEICGEMQVAVRQCAEL